MNKRFLLAILFLLIGFASFSQYTVQSKYFVYLQTEPAQPFYIKIDRQTLQANSSGYLILPQLRNGDYKLVVGFPGNKTPEMTFDFKIDAKDKGYLIKNLDAEGWSLFDLQTMAVQKPLTAEELAARAEAEKPKPRSRKKDAEEQQETQAAIAQQSAPPAQPPTAAPQQTQTPAPAPDTASAAGVSDFTKVLSKATNDPSLLEKPKPEEKPQETAPAPTADAGTNEVAATPSEKGEVPASDVAVTENTAPIGETAASAAGKPAAGKKKKGDRDMVKLSQNETKEGISVLYEDRTEDQGNQQIHITIPVAAGSGAAATAAGQVTPAATAPATTGETPSTDDVAAAADQSEKGEEAGEKDKFQVEEKPAIEETPAESAEAAPVAVSENCKKVASESDFLNLRRSMASRDNDDKMIDEAKKAFKNKCYTTAQVKYLSSMFLSNAGKFNFYEAALGHVADPQNFPGLKSEIKDDYYQEKFTGLLKN